MARPRRTKRDATERKPKKKVSILDSEAITWVDYKDVALLRRFMSERAKVRARRVTGNDAQQQREVARAIKNAREMALLPYANRVAQQRGGRNRDRDREDSELSARDAGVTEADERRRPPEAEGDAGEGDVEVTETEDLAEVES